jgi:hypothetical protein
MSPSVDFGSSVRRLPTRWVALRKSGAFRHGEPQRVGLDGASAPTPHALEDQPLAKQPSSSRADEPHGLLAAQARQGRGVIGIHKCQPATTATVPGSPTGWIWVLAGFGYWLDLGRIRPASLPSLMRRASASALPSSAHWSTLSIGGCPSKPRMQSRYRGMAHDRKLAAAAEEDWGK